MARYVTTEEKITCKNCTVEFTERELVEEMCPCCHMYPFKCLNIHELRLRHGRVFS